MHRLVFLCTPTACISKRCTDFCVLKSPAITNKSQLNNLQYRAKVKQKMRKPSHYSSWILLLFVRCCCRYKCAQLSVSDFLQLIWHQFGSKVCWEVCASPKPWRLYRHRVNLTLYIYIYGPPHHCFLPSPSQDMHSKWKVWFISWNRVGNISLTLCMLQSVVKFKSHLYFEEKDCVSG